VQLSSEKIPCSVFRPNIVISRISHIENDATSTLQTYLRDERDMLIECDAQFSKISLFLGFKGPCQRCSMVDVDSRTGKIDGNVYRTLATAQVRDNREDIQAITYKKVYFGQFFAYSGISLATANTFSCVCISTGNLVSSSNK